MVKPVTKWAHRVTHTERIPDLVAQALRIAESKLARAIPLYVRFEARGRPIVGTSIDYFEFRGAKLATGRWPGLLGQAVVGHRVAEAEPDHGVVRAARGDSGRRRRPVTLHFRK